MKKILCLILSVIMSVSLLAVPLCAQAETTYWVDMDFAKNNAEKLKTYIKTNGMVDVDGDKVIQYYDDQYGFNFLIIYETNTDALYFWADFGDAYDMVEMYYAYPELTPQLLIYTENGYVTADVKFDMNYYNYDDLSFNVIKSNGTYTQQEVDKYGNLALKAAIEGWNICLSQNTSYTLASIGFNDLCTHNMNKTYYAASFNSDGLIEDYCYKCGYLEKTDIPGVSAISVSRKSFTYNGKTQKPSVTVVDVKGNVISADNYTITYSNSSSKKVGSYNMLVSFVGSKYSGSQVFTYSILPKSTSISSLKGAKKKITVKYKKQTSQTTGYQIQGATDKAFKKNKKTVTVKKNKTTSASLTSLKSGKKYYVRVRTYKTVNGKKIYSAWSKVKTVKVK